MTLTIPDIWDAVHENSPRDTYPSEDIIRIVARTFFHLADRSAVRALDLGCGKGPMAWFLAREGFTLSAVDGSPVAVTRCRDRLDRDQLTADVRTADLAALPYADATFDLCHESQCLMCNDAPTTRRIVAEVWRVLKPGGLFISRTPAVDCHGYGVGTPLADNCFRDAPDGPFAHMGLARFLDPADAQALYAPFTIQSLDSTRYTLGNGSYALSYLVLQCRKEA